MKQSVYKVNKEQKKGRPRIHPLHPFEVKCDQSTKKGLQMTEPKINKPSWLQWQLSNKEIYIDGEWHFNTNPQKFYLLGYAYDKKHFGWLYNQNDYSYNNKVYYKPQHKGVNGLNRTWLLNLLKDVKTIYFYGPDAGQLERMFHIKLKDKYRCVNLLKANKSLRPGEKSYKLIDLEKHYGIKRLTREYKKDIDNLHRDWYNPKLRAKALLYNKEDVINLIKTKEALYKEFNVTKEMEQEWILGVTKKDKQKFKTR